MRILWCRNKKHT